MVQGFYRDLTKILKYHGFTKLSGGGGKGSHEKWRHPDKAYTLTIPPGTKSRHTANAILKEAGINEKL